MRIAEHRRRWDITDAGTALGTAPTSDAERRDRRAMERSLDRTRALIARALEPPEGERQR